MHVGKAIRILRVAAGFGLGTLAREAGVSVPYLSLVECEKRSPSIDVVSKIAGALKVPSDVLLLLSADRSSTLRPGDELTERLLRVLKDMDVVEKRIKDAINQDP